MSENGRLSNAELASIPGGKLSHEAAAAWNAPGGPADAGLLPTGSESSYRTYEGQVKQRDYWCGQGKCENAAVPGTSNHGLGKCVDLAANWMRAWIDEHGAEFGWRKTEAPSEWWHVNFVGGVDFPSFEPLRKGAEGKRVLRLAKRLAFIHEPGGKAFLADATSKFDAQMEKAVRDFQTAYKLKVDGVIGPKTASRIHGVFHRQYEERGDQR